MSSYPTQAGIFERFGEGVSRFAHLMRRAGVRAYRSVQSGGLVKAHAQAAPLEPAVWPADPEIHYHLHFKPYIALNIGFDPQPMLREALSVRDRFVAHRYGKSEQGESGRWMSLALQARGGDYRKTEYDGNDAIPYALTEIADRCPATMAFLEGLTDIAQCGRIRFMLLEPGGIIPVHHDYEDKLWPAGLAVNISLNMPEGCHFYADARPDGTHTKYTVQVPFADSGSVMLFNNAKYHHLVNDSAVPRIHIIFHGPLRYPASRILADARKQNDLHAESDVLRAILWKRVQLGESIGSDEALTKALLHARRIVGMWPDHIRLLIVDTVIGDNEALRSECLHRITAASVYPLAYEIMKPEDVDAWLAAHEGAGISHVVIVGSGTFIQKGEDFVLGVFSTISEMCKHGAPVAGHLIDRMKQYDNLPYLHEQFVVLDVELWKACGRPKFGAMYSTEVQRTFPGYRPSDEQIHDDYTPQWIAADPQCPPQRGLTWWGTRVIAAAIEHNKKVINVPDELRTAKRFAYPNVESHPDLNAIRQVIDETLTYIHNWVYCFNTEENDIPHVPGFEPDRVISVAAGLKWIAILRQYERPGVVPELVLADYSALGIQYVEAMLHASTYDELVNVIAEYSHRNPSYHLSVDEIRAGLDAFIASIFSGSMEAFFTLKRGIARWQTSVGDFVLEPNRVLQHIDPRQRTIFWHSNAWNSHAVLYKLSPQEIEDNYLSFLRHVKNRLGLRAFRRRQAHLAIFGESFRNVHTLLTDGNASAFSGDEREWDEIE